MRATECGEEAWSVNREPMNTNRIEGAVEQDEWAVYHEALVTNARWRKCGGCAMKVCVLTWVCRDCPDLKLSNRRVRTRMPGGVAGVSPIAGDPLCR